MPGTILYLLVLYILTVIIPEFMAIHRSPRQALFSTYSRQAVQTLSSLPQSTPPLPLILLTGGLRTPELLYSALSSGHAHLLGIGRGSVLCPHLPLVLKQREDEGRREGRKIQDIPGWDEPFSPEPDLEPGWKWNWILERIPKIPLLGAGVNMAWYVVEMRRLAGGCQEKDGIRDSVSAIGAVFWMWVWVDERALQGTPVWALWCLYSIGIGYLIIFGPW